ncbi:potassium transporter [Paraburkholderia ginsengiterrae]|uniref:Potassium transporter n=1 Tax=Paraburkholderia ginsengiterrae TaxID=1462993 RepID=A0A1A9MZ58_9BURK|nr:potassium channel family protein [Paraburkholderia ginsengiterrae]OAJ53492.1 potassium transporter [Paraburkholderia ginsengiterrae]OAJ59044.1 potassium transporter [Paraburkholderia ginsengiterrae]
MDSELGNFGLGGVDSHDGPRAIRAWRRVRWVLCALSFLAIPAFYIELNATAQFSLTVARTLYLCMFAGFASLLTWMHHVSRKPKVWLAHNRLDLVIMIGSGLSAGFGATPWQPAEWFLRMAFMCLVALRIVLSLRSFFTPNRLVWLLVAGACVLAMAGAGFYWLEPRVHSYADGLWLAFKSGATVGYGDFAPTTPASRVFAAFVVLLGYGMLSLVFASIAAAFIGKEERALRHEMHRDIKRLSDEIIRMHVELNALRKALNISGGGGDDVVQLRPRDAP